MLEQARGVSAQLRPGFVAVAVEMDTSLDSVLLLVARPEDSKKGAERSRERTTALSAEATVWRARAGSAALAGLDCLVQPLGGHLFGPRAKPQSSVLAGPVSSAPSCQLPQ